MPRTRIIGQHQWSHNFIASTIERDLEVLDKRTEKCNTVTKGQYRGQEAPQEATRFPNQKSFFPSILSADLYTDSDAKEEEETEGGEAERELESVPRNFNQFLNRLIFRNQNDSSGDRERSKESPAIANRLANSSREKSSSKSQSSDFVEPAGVFNKKGSGAHKGMISSGKEAIEISVPGLADVIPLPRALQEGRVYVPRGARNDPRLPVEQFAVACDERTHHAVDEREVNSGGNQEEHFNSSQKRSMHRSFENSSDSKGKLAIRGVIEGRKGQLRVCDDDVDDARPELPRR